MCLCAVVCKLLCVICVSPAASGDNWTCRVPVCAPKQAVGKNILIEELGVNGKSRGSGGTGSV